MTPLTIYQDNGFKTTAVSNYFIDEYMLSANATQIKVYLYLLRMMGEGLSISLCSIADFFDYPEKDDMFDLHKCIENMPDFHIPKRL